MMPEQKEVEDIILAKDAEYWTDQIITSIHIYMNEDVEDKLRSKILISVSGAMQYSRTQQTIEAARAAKEAFMYLASQGGSFCVTH